MKKSLLFLLFLFAILSGIAQPPQTFKYQAVVRNASGNILGNQLIGLKISILMGSPTGNAEYIETHQIATNEFGIVNINVGQGIALMGSFAGINWGSNSHYIKTELDLTGNGNYSFIGTTPLLSVPYALLAEKTMTSLSDHDTSSSNEIQKLSRAADTLLLSKGGKIDLTDFKDNTDNQVLSLNGTTLNISNGNSVQIVDNDKQTLSFIGTTLNISNGNSVQLNGTVDLDADPTNELQVLNKSNDTIFLSKGNFVVLPTVHDRDSSNELQALKYSKDTLYLSKGNFVVLPHDFDRDSTNEIQSLKYSKDTLYLSKSNYTLLPHDNDNNSPLNNFGSGYLGNFHSIGNYNLAACFMECKNFTIRPQDTIFINETVIIRVQDTCKIQGVVYGKGKSNYYSSNYGSSGGGGGGLFALDNNILNSGYQGDNGNSTNFQYKTGINNIYSQPAIFSISGGIGGLVSQNPNNLNGGIGNPIDTSILKLLLTSNELPSIGGSTGGRGSTPCSISQTYYPVWGGLGGAGLYIICKYLIFTGVINLEGNDGDNGILCNDLTGCDAPGLTAGAGGGGGGGGSVIIKTNKILQNTGVPKLSGGKGGKSSVPGSAAIGFPGGDGADGIFKLIH